MKREAPPKASQYASRFSQFKKIKGQKFSIIKPPTFDLFVYSIPNA